MIGRRGCAVRGCVRCSSGSLPLLIPGILAAGILVLVRTVGMFD